MFRALADLSQLELVDVVPEQLVDSESERALKRGGRRKAGAKGNISGENAVETLDFATSFDGLPADTEDVTSPLLFRLVLFFEAKLGTLVIVNRESPDFVCPVGLDLCHYTAINCSREHITTVVVGVLTDKIDSSGRGKNLTLGLVQGLEFFPDSGFHVHNYAIRALIVFYSYKNNKLLFKHYRYGTMIAYSS